MEIIYQTIIRKIGAIAHDALDEKMFITFKDNIPLEIVDYCFIHCHGELTHPIQVGDIVEIDDIEYPITAVGDVASDNLKRLGHVTWRFDNALQAEYPGTVHLQGNVPKNIGINSVLKIKRG